MKFNRWRSNSISHLSTWNHIQG